MNQERHDLVAAYLGLQGFEVVSFPAKSAVDPTGLSVAAALA